MVDRSNTKLNLQVGQESDTGVIRKRNEDHAASFVPSDEAQRRTKGAIFVVADGIGGNRAGDVASQNAVEWVMEAYYADRTHGTGESLVQAIGRANQRLHELAQGDPDLAGMGTTLVAAVVREDPFRLTVASVGDSRAYLLRDGSLQQLTTDHSWVEEQVKVGLLTSAQAARHPQRNIITRALGLRPAVEVDVTEPEVQAGDRLLLCTDGLSGQLPESQMTRLLRDGAPARVAAELVAEANQRGGRDNVSTVVVQLGPPPAPRVQARIRDGVDTFVEIALEAQERLLALLRPRIGEAAFDVLQDRRFAIGLVVLLLVCFVCGGMASPLLFSQEFTGNPAAAPHVAPIDARDSSGWFSPRESGVIVVGRVRDWQKDCNFRLTMADKEYQVRCVPGHFIDPETSLKGRRVWVFGHQQEDDEAVKARLIDLGAPWWALWQDPWRTVYANHDWSQEVWVYTVVDERLYSAIDVEDYSSLERGTQILVQGRWPQDRLTNTNSFQVTGDIYRLEGNRYVPWAPDDG